MTDRHWLVWIIGMFAAGMVARQVGTWFLLVAIVGLLVWTVTVENRPVPHD